MVRGDLTDFTSANRPGYMLIGHLPTEFRSLLGENQPCDLSVPEIPVGSSGTRTVAGATPVELACSMDHVDYFFGRVTHWAVVLGSRLRSRQLVES